MEVGLSVISRRGPLRPIRKRRKFALSGPVPDRPMDDSLCAVFIFGKRVDLRTRAVY